MRVTIRSDGTATGTQVVGEDGTPLSMRSDLEALAKKIGCKVVPE